MVVLMTFETRKDLGFPESEAREQPHNPDGVKIHYLGTKVKRPAAHSGCRAMWTQIRNSHLANKKENYSDVAYSLAVCNAHGTVMEGRGAGKRTGANGNSELNYADYAIVVLIGDEGDTRPTPQCIVGIREAIHYLRTHKRPCGKRIQGHRDGIATSCPGGPLYDLVGSGQLEPDRYTPPTPSPAYAPFPGAAFFKVGKKDKLFTAVGKRLVAEGFKGYRVGPSDTWGPRDEEGVEWFQKKQGWSGTDADGKFGPETWKRLKVPKS